MRPLRQWSLVRVLVACIAWVLVWTLVPLVSVALTLRSQMAEVSAAGSGGIGAVSSGVNGALVFVPPALFFVMWVIARRRGRRTQQAA